jgi:hypothetical protein
VDEKNILFMSGSRRRERQARSAIARRSGKWKNKVGGGGEEGLAVRPLFKMYVAYGWPKLLSISAGSSKYNIVHLIALQDWLLLVSSSRVQIWNASQVSE